MDFSQEIEFQTPGAVLSLRADEWESLAQLQDRPDRNHLILSLPPINYEGAMRFPEVMKGAPRRIGRTFFRPAGVLTESWGTGGRASRLRCSFTPERVAEALDHDDPWHPEQFERCCDMERSALPALLHRIVTEMCVPGFGHAAMMDALINQAIIEVARYLNRDESGPALTGRLTRAQLDLIQARVHCEERRPPSVAELAVACGLSERHLLRLFRATVGSSVSAFVRRESIARAQRLLSETDTPLKQIAYRLGFSGPSSFSLAFRTATGMTPAEYRNASAGGRTILSS